MYVFFQLQTPQQPSTVNYYSTPGSVGQAPIQGPGYYPYSIPPGYAPPPPGVAPYYPPYQTAQPPPYQQQYAGPPHAPPPYEQSIATAPQATPTTQRDPPTTEDEDHEDTSEALVKVN